MKYICSIDTECTHYIYFSCIKKYIFPIIVRCITVKKCLVHPSDRTKNPYLPTACLNVLANA